MSPADILSLFLCTLLSLPSTIFGLEIRHSASQVRQRRQLGSQLLANSASSAQIDLNSTVPFIFSARLYPFGEKNGDVELVGEVSEFKLQRPLLFFERSFDTIWVHPNGIVSLAPGFVAGAPKSLPLAGAAHPLIAVFWTRGRDPNRRRTFIRETSDENILGLAQNEVNIQFRYGSDFEPESIVVVTWEEGDRAQNAHPTVLFQLALILGKNACFAHFIFSKLPAGEHAISGFNGPPTVAASVPNAAAEEEQTTAQPAHFSLPGSDSQNAVQVQEKSNIGIPGEWLMRVDDERIFLCGAGFQGLECVDSCLPTQWHLDCSRSCHCADAAACNVESGECPDGGKCSPGWRGSPICDEDIDECQDDSISCPDEQPDCMNTPGAYLCFCFEYDNSTGTCIGSSDENSDGTAPKVSAERIPVPVASMSLIPQLSGAAKGAKPQRTEIQTAPQQQQKTVLLSTQRPLTIRPALVPSLHVPAAPPTLLSSPRRQLPAPNSQRSAQSGHSEGSDAFEDEGEFDDDDAAEAADGNGNGRPQQECAGCDPNAQCVRGKCECAGGWTGSGRQCSDLDECSTNTTICGLNAECQNLFGSYQCVCNAGFVASQNGLGCVDVDECESSMSAGSSSPAAQVCPQPNTVCRNNIGGFECQCKTGFTGNPSVGCQDTNECEMAEYYCGRHANCTNLDGSFGCECHEGFEKQANSNHCKDVDECARHVCHRAANCLNLEGGFHCECMDGFIGDGIECHETILFPTASPRKHSLFDKKPSNATATVRLDVPYTVFGQDHSTAFVHSSGAISFGSEPILDENFAQEVRSGAPIPGNRPTVLLPLFVLNSSRTMEIHQIDERSMNAKGLFARATFLVQNQFRIAEFRVQRLMIVTWSEDYSPPNTSTERLAHLQTNKFQAVLIRGSSPAENMTFGVFLYEQQRQPPKQQQQPLVGLLHPLRGLHSVPTEGLLANSNVGQPGKWVFRIDGADKVYACPSGTQNPPLCQSECVPGHWGLDCSQSCNCANGVPCDFGSGSCAGGCAVGFEGRSCQQDVDECALGLHRCDRSAKCANLRGSYSCTCSERFLGDGFNCTRITTCVQRFNADCAENGHCDESIGEQLPECVCNEGFHGDGRRQCQPNAPTTTSNTFMTSEPSLSTFSRIAVSTSTAAPIPRWSIATTTAHRQHSPSAKSGNQAEVQEKKQRTEKEQQLHRDNELLLAATNESGTLVLVVCALIGGIWLFVLILFSLIYCCRRHRRLSRSQYSPQMLRWAPATRRNGTLSSRFT